MLNLPKYIKTKDQKDAFFGFVAYFSLTLVFLIYEYNLIPPEKKALYTCLRLASILLAAPIMFRLTINPYNQVLLFFMTLLLMSFSIIGEFFSPLYFFAYVAITMSIILLYRIKNLIIYPMILLGGAGVLAVQYLKQNGFLNRGREVAIGDYTVIFFEFILIFFYLNEWYTKSRKDENSLKERLQILGQNTQSFAHNIKSVMASQFIIVENIKENIESSIPVEELLQIQDTNLEEIRKYLNSFNLLVLNENEKVSLKGSIKQSIYLLGIGKETVNFSGDDIFLNGTRQDIETLFISIFSNIKKGFQYSNKQIECEFSNKMICIKTPFIEDFPTSSGIGNLLVERLADKNELVVEYSLLEETYIIKIKVK